jgi:hypothetical protein
MPPWKPLFVGIIKVLTTIKQNRLQELGAIFYFCSMQVKEDKKVQLVWRAEWQDLGFRQRFQWGLLVWVLVLIAFPFFFQFIEQRSGWAPNDWVLDQLPSYDTSIPCFLVIWGMFGLFFYRSLYQPRLLLLFLWGFIVLSLMRFCSIYLLPLEPPANLIPLRDPISNLFYGGKDAFITKDLFFSGHTSTQFLIFLCLSKKSDKWLALIASFAIGIMVLIQHVHYTMDVLAAPPLTYLVYIIAKKIASY